MRLAYISLPVKNLPPETIRYSHWDCVDICFLCYVNSTSGLGYCFYFRFVPDGVLHSRTVSMPVEVDRACPKTVSSRWDHVEMSSRRLVITTSGKVLRSADCKAIDYQLSIFAAKAWQLWYMTHHSLPRMSKNSAAHFWSFTRYLADMF